MIRTIPDGGINWCWYLCADFNDTDMTCHIYYYERWHRYEHRGSYHPVSDNGVGRLQLVECDKRIVRSVKLIKYDSENNRNGCKEYKVTNPDHVFSYRDMTHYVADKS